MILSFIFILHLLNRSAYGVLVNGGIFRQTWMEVGFVTVRSDKFTLVNGVVKNLTLPHVFIGPPRDGNYLINSGGQMCARLKNVKKGTLTSTVSFNVKLTQPNDTWCNYTWWTPSIIPSQQLSYMIMAQGHYNVSGAEFDASSQSLNSHCVYYTIRHIWFHQFYNTKVKPLSIATIQSYNDYRFATFREVSTNNNAVGVTLYMQLHNFNKKWHPRIGDCVNNHYNDHYDNNRFRQAYTMTYETVSVLGYSPNYVATCEDGIVFETHQVDGITSDSRWYPFYWKYNSPPGVFGMVNSFTGGDSVTIRTFNYSLIGVGMVLQEDQCDKQSVIHLQGEKIAFFVAGVVNLAQQVYNPYTGIVTHIPPSECCICLTGANCASPSCHPSSPPTVSPTPLPTTAPTLTPTTKPTATPTVPPTSQPTGEPSGQPSQQPSMQPSAQPSGQPSGQPSFQPSGQPTSNPSRLPVSTPTGAPTSQPTNQPTQQPTNQPSTQPTGQPTTIPSAQPTTQPSMQPSTQPTSQPTVQPTGQPSVQPTGQPTAQPTGQPTSQPTVYPTAQPTDQPTMQPSDQPSSQPTAQPSGQPTVQPTMQPSDQPTMQPSGQPTSNPSKVPATFPTSIPSGQPSNQPSGQPSGQPSAQPSSQPTIRPSSQPSAQPSHQPSGQPSNQPTQQPSGQPSNQPSGMPSAQPTAQPTSGPSTQPTALPITPPSGQPTTYPTESPSNQPTNTPSAQPSGQPSHQPSAQPSGQPSNQPTGQPSAQPTSTPSALPSNQPSGLPSSQPTIQPSMQPSNQPTAEPSGQPTMQPTSLPTGQPTAGPSRIPTVSPTAIPTVAPTPEPSVIPTVSPTSEPTTSPTILPKCPWVAKPLGLCRPGDDLAVFQDVSIGDCQNFCISAVFVSSSYNAAAGTCTLVYNIVSETLPSSQSDCAAAAAAAALGGCDSICFTPNSSGAGGTCTLKYARAGNLVPSANAQAITYDFNCVTTEPTVTPTTRPTVYYPPVCVKFVLADTFGDSWGTGQFYSYDSSGRYKTDKSSCKQNVVMVEHCIASTFASPGDTLNATLFGFQPDNAWETLWQAIIVNTGQVYTGSYNTWMTFTFNFTNTNPKVPYLTFSSPQSQNVLSSNVDCQTCVRGEIAYEQEGNDLEECSQKSVVQPKSITIRRKRYHSEFYGYNYTVFGSIVANGLFFNRSAVYSLATYPDAYAWTASAYVSRKVLEMSSSILNIIPSYSQRPTDSLEVDVQKESSRRLDYIEADQIGQDGDIDADNSYSLNDYYLFGRDMNNDERTTSWFTGGRDSAYFHISDIDGQDLYYTGTLCHGSYVRTPCNLDLPHGRYMWRVTGVLESNKEYVAFEFCGVRGGYSTELIFEVNCDGECVPLWLRDLQDVCEWHQQYIEQVEKVISEQPQPTPAPTSDEDCNNRIHEVIRCKLHRNPTLITLEGVVQVQGPLGRPLSEQERQAIASTLSDEFVSAKKVHSSDDGMQPELLEVTSVRWLSDQSSLLPLVSASDSRQLHAVTHSGSIRAMHLYELSFRLVTVSERYGVDGSTDGTVQELTSGLSQYLQQSMQSGLLLKKLATRADEQGLGDLHDFNSMKLLSMKAVSVERHRDKPLTQASLGAMFMYTLAVVLTVISATIIATWRRLAASTRISCQESNVLESAAESKTLFVSAPSILRTLHGALDAVHDQVGEGL